MGAMNGSSSTSLRGNLKMVLAALDASTGGNASTELDTVDISRSRSLGGYEVGRANRRAGERIEFGGAVCTHVSAETGALSSTNSAASGAGMSAMPSGANRISTKQRLSNSKVIVAARKGVPSGGRGDIGRVGTTEAKATVEVQELGVGAADQDAAAVVIAIAVVGGDSGGTNRGRNGGSNGSGDADSGVEGIAVLIPVGNVNNNHHLHGESRHGSRGGPGQSDRGLRATSDLAEAVDGRVMTNCTVGVTAAELLSDHCSSRSSSYPRTTVLTSTINSMQEKSLDPFSARHGDRVGGC